MLSRLYIENAAVIEKAMVNFQLGFSAMTGETGAGKSILIDAINLILGERASREIIRAGKSQAYVSAVFSALSPEICNVLLEYGIAPDENGELFIERELSQEGKGVCRISGRPSTVAVLREISGYLVNIHGQHDNQSLLKPEKHLVFLDRYARVEEELNTYRLLYQQAKHIKNRLKALDMDEREKATKIDLLTYQLEEIDAANLQQGEEEELVERQTILRNAERIAAVAGNSYELLYGAEEERTALQCLSLAAEELHSVSRYAKELELLSSRLEEARYALSDCAEELHAFLETTEFSAEELAALEERLDLIYRLKKKYGSSVEEILAYGEKCREELDTISLGDAEAEKLRQELEKVKIELREAGECLSEKRKRAAKEMEKSVMSELASLDMSRVIFKAGFEYFLINGKIAYTADGLDKVEFFISTNPGEPLKPLAKIASGGELSRIMLALKVVLAKEDDVDTLIFDEIDTGVSGSAADKIGRKLRKLAAKKQTLCVTHLSQIASLADHQYLIEKKVGENRSFTHVTLLDDEGRKREIARMISGADITAAALKTAEEMLSENKN